MAVIGASQQDQAALALAHRRRIARRRSVRVAVYVMVVFVVVIFTFPSLWMLITTLKTPEELAASGINVIPHSIYLQNYVDATTQTPFFQYMFNTMVICLPNVLGTVLSCSLAAYALACVRWPGRGVSFGVVLATMMLPYPVTIIPLYLVFRALGWLNVAGGYLPLTVPAFFGAPFFIFLLRQFFGSIPLELSEAARVDGASELTFLYTYTDFLNPLIYISDPNRFTLALGLLGFFGAHGPEFGPLMAASALFTIPTVLLFLAAQRTFIQGIATTGLKG